jgi:hypothetical protein
MKLISRYSLHHSFTADQTELPDLRALIAPWVPQRIRRIDRYIELCVAGGLNCVAGRQLPEDTGVYLATRAGAVSTPAQVMEGIFARQDTPMPLLFVNTLGNTAGFYLTQLLHTKGNTLVVAQEQLSFEAALLHAWIDLQQGRIRTALVGGFDEAALPLAHHAQRLGIAAQDEIAEGSHWLLLAAETEATAAITLGNPTYFSDVDVLLVWLRQQGVQHVQCAFTPSADEQTQLAMVVGEVQTCTQTGISQGAFSGGSLIELCGWVEQKGKSGIHLARNFSQGDVSNYCALRVDPS